MEVRVGCSGWSYRGWVGPFYPKNTKQEDYLRVYSHIFSTVEIDSTFYGIPSTDTVRSWKKATPENFVFCPKMPKAITHDMRLRDSDANLDRFLSVIKELGSKLGTFLIQMPPSFTFKRDHKNLESFLSVLPESNSYALELRNPSWFRDDLYRMLEDNGVTLVWSEIPNVAIPPVATSESAYIRFVGDRTIREEDFGSVQKDRSGTIKKWADRLESQKANIRHAFVFANNHFQGFGPFTVRLFSETMGLEKVDFPQGPETVISDKQKTLF